MVFQVLYGIEMGLNSISVDPWLHNEMGAAGARGVGGTSRAEQAGSGQSRLGVGEEQADKEDKAGNSAAQDEPRPGAVLPASPGRAGESLGGRSWRLPLTLMGH